MNRRRFCSGAYPICFLDPDPATFLGPDRHWTHPLFEMNCLLLRLHPTWHWQKSNIIHWIMFRYIVLWQQNLKFSFHQLNKLRWQHNWTGLVTAIVQEWSARMWSLHQPTFLHRSTPLISFTERWKPRTNSWLYFDMFVFYDWPHVYFAKNVAYFPFNSWLSFQRLSRLLWG